MYHPCGTFTRFRKDGLVSGTYDIVFDGGSKGDPGLGYGSYEITLDDEVIARTTLEYGDRVTNNQAEYTTLVRALEWLAEGKRRNWKYENC